MINFLKQSQQVLIISSNQNNEIKIIDPQTSGVLQTYQNDIGIKQNGLLVFQNYIMNIQQQKTLINVQDFNKQIQYKIATEEVLSLLKEQNNMIFGATANGNLNIWQGTTGNLIMKAFLHKKEINKIKFCLDNKYFITSSLDFTLQLHSIDHLLLSNSCFYKQQFDRYRFQQQYVGHRDIITDFEITDLKIFSVSRDKQLIIWDLQSGQKLKTINFENSLTSIKLNLLQNIAFVSDSKGALFKVNIESQSYVEYQDFASKKEKEVLFSPEKILEIDQPIWKIIFWGQQSQLITIDQLGQIRFLDFDGKVLKSLSLFTQVSNVQILDRPQYFKSTLSSQNSYKKPEKLVFLKQRVEQNEQKINFNNQQSQDIDVLSHSEQSEILMNSLFQEQEENVNIQNDIENQEYVNQLIQENKKLKEQNQNLFNQIEAEF